MGSFVFKWPHAAEEVYVTGTFDNWEKTVKLEKVGDVFEKAVELPDASNKILYKFVVDGAWVTDSTAPKEKDASGNDNNVLTPEDIVKSAPATAAILASAAPQSTTAQLAGGVPLEEKKEAKEEQKPAKPEETSVASTVTAPIAAAASGVAAAGAAAVAAVTSTADKAKMSEKPEDLPGTFPETPASELNKEVKLINPLPAAPGGVNPVKLAPGEKVPESLRSGDVNANVKLDPESYEKADAATAGDFSSTQLPPVSKNMIPESSLPIAGSNDFTINSAAPASTTAALAGAVPLEKDKATAAGEVPAVVKESQKEAGVPPEASAVPAEVVEKEQVEEELLKKVPEAPATSDGTASTSAFTVGGATAAAAGLGAAAIATATTAKDKVAEQAAPAYDKAAAAVGDAATNLPVSVKQVLPTSVQEQIASAAATAGQPVASDVPAEVKESIQEAGISPEAAANATAVEEKKAVEAELLKKAEPANEPAASASSPAVAVNGKDAAPVSAAAPTAPTGGSTPAATTSATTATPATPSKSTAAASTSKTSSPATAEKKKKHRLSGFFHKIFDKKDGDKK